VVTASADGTARVWDATSGQPLTPSLRHDRKVACALFSLDDRIVLTVSWDRTARLWDAESGQPLGPSLQHGYQVNDLDLAPDGRRFVTAELQGAARVWTMPRDDRPAPDLIRLAHLLAAHRIDATTGLVPLSSTELQTTWRTLSTKYPHDFTASTEMARAWREREAEESEKSLDWFAALHHLEFLVELVPSDGLLLARYGRAYAELGEWENAVQAYEQALKRGAHDPWVWSYRPLASLRDGDPDAYRTACKELWERHGDKEDYAATYALAWNCTLAPNALPDADEPVRLAQRALAADPMSFYAMSALGAAFYRTGKYQEAIQLLTEANNLHRRILGREGPPMTWVYLAMAQHRLGQTAQAMTWFDKTTQWHVHNPPGKMGERNWGYAISWENRLALQLLLGEAEDLLKPTGTENRN
jgi:tetratricopeptide (TPR) repeat protein